MPLRTALVGLMMCLLVVGCTSTPAQIQTAPMGSNEKALGEASGSSTGVMLLWFIPIGQNDRFHDAYDEAIQVHPGTTRLVNPTITEQWFWALILGGFTTEVSGTAVGPKK
ncbi:MAG: hypothetical protein JSU59_11205 [Nitrospirota bacterium]|nr:MAG: hypothetical protein JSU59_11205 [Nitrospirota bacterium]